MLPPLTIMTPLIAPTADPPLPAPREEVPLCPPVFEGDFWLLEFARISKQMTAKPVRHHNQHTQPSLLLSNQGGATADALRTVIHDKQSNQRKCREILKHISGKSTATVFMHPVDPIALSIPTYFNIVTHPMDLSTVKEKLRTGKYSTVLDFAQVTMISIDCVA